jgi:EAL domain-containing protein (putative c-di-GMP-specific phosphodiesterase class I)
MLAHIVYASTAVSLFDRQDLLNLLSKAHARNAHRGITGMLLHQSGDFFQVIEGSQPVVAQLFAEISWDVRHNNMVKIIEEPIANRLFADWTMALADVTQVELSEIDGLNDYFCQGLMFSKLGVGRAKKLLDAFGSGRWRHRLSGVKNLADLGEFVPASNAHACSNPPVSVGESESPVSYAFQPIVDAQERRVISYEALIRGRNGESARAVLGSVHGARLHQFDADGRMIAVALAMRLGLACDLNLNLIPWSLLDKESAQIDSMLDAAEKLGLSANRIVMEITEGELIHDHARFSTLIDAYRTRGVKVAIDDFGAGYSGLNLLAAFQPDQLKIDMGLIRGVASDGPKQAIVRGIVSVCFDLGIDVIAEGVETHEEFDWLTSAGGAVFSGFPVW